MTDMDLSMPALNRALASAMRDHTEIVRPLGEADRNAGSSTRTHDRAYTRALLKSTYGSEKMRIADAQTQVEELRELSEIAEAVVRDLKRQLANCELRIETARTLQATARQELRSLGAAA